MKFSLPQFFKVSVLLFLSTSLLCFPASAQNDRYEIRGKVLDANSGQPLQGASVFAQNTTLGVTSDAQGDFAIRLPDGGYSLTVTFSGYETEVVRVNNNSPNNSNLIFSLEPQVKSLEEISIVITNEVEDGWEKYGTFFKDNFLGQSAFASQCVITNPEILHFFFYKKKNRLKVTATEPLLIDNPSLGYRLKFAIDSFTTDYSSKTSLFIGYPLFEEMEGTEEQQSLWYSNRKSAYEGSMLHFMRSLYDSALDENNFFIRFVFDKSKKQELNFLEKLPDSLLFRMLNYTKNTANNTATFLVPLANLAIIYKKSPDPVYLDLHSGEKLKFQISTLKFLNPKEPVIIEQNGFYYDQENLLTNGYLAFKKIGDMLPYDYNPEELPKKNEPKPDLINTESPVNNSNQ
ncbi:MAG: carboxypeptidase-like regulatory domain-containing protein [Ginsengibacter sp.]